MIFLFRKFKNLLLNLLNLILLLKFIADNHKYIPVIYDDSFSRRSIKDRLTSLICKRSFYRLSGGFKNKAPRQQKMILLIVSIAGEPVMYCPVLLSEMMFLRV